MQKLLKFRFETESKYQEILSSYDDTDSEDSQMNSESEDEIIMDMARVAAEMKNHVDLNKTVEDKQALLLLGKLRRQQQQNIPSLKDF